MQIPVKNIMFTVDVPAKKFAQVAKGGIDKVLSDTVDHSQDLGLFEAGIDLVRGGPVKTTLGLVHDMSRHFASLHQEFEKPIMQRNQKMMKEHVDGIEESQEGLRRRMPCQTLEFGRKDKTKLDLTNNSSDLIVGKKSYLILRDKSCLAPIGIPVRDRDEPDQSAYPDLPVVPDAPQNITSGIPKFETYKKIQHVNLKAIRDHGRLECAGKIYKVNCHKGTEPIIISATPNWASMLIQFRLSRLWIIDQSRSAIGELNQVQPSDGELSLPSILPEPQIGQVRSVAESTLEESWRAIAERTKDSFREVTANLQKPFLDKKKKLISMFAELENEDFTSLNQRTLLLENLAKIPSIPLRQIDANNNITFLKNMYARLFTFARECNDLEIREIIKNRIINFNFCLENFTSSKMGGKDIVTRGHDGEVTLEGAQAVRQLNTTLKNQSGFLKNFNSSEIAQCHALLNPRDIIFPDESRLAAPRLPTLRKALIKALADPNAGWMDVKNAMVALKSAQENIVIALTLQYNTASKVRQYFHEFMGQDGEGLNLESGMSFYTPEIYSRIITLKQIRDELSILDKPLAQIDLEKIDTEISDHVRQIQPATTVLRTGEINEMYEPDLNANGSPMNYRQWQKYQKDLKRGQ